jgi:hypothetical protein
MNDRRRRVRAWALPALLLAAVPAAWANPGDGIGKTASQCFVIYKIASGLPANVGHKDAFAGLGGLMGRTMQDSQVSKAQFDAWADELLQRIGSPKAPDAKAMSAQVETCNAFAKQRYAHYAPMTGK